MMHGRRQAKTAGANDHVRGGRQHRAEHVDQADDGGADADHAAADLIQHPRNRYRRGVESGRGFHPADFVDQT